METTLILPAPKLRSKILVLLFEVSKPIYRKTFKHFTKAWRIQRSDLSHFEAPSLGYHLYQFLLQHDFELEAKLESHDVGHVLLGYDTDVVGEICMQFFYLGSGKKSVYSLLTTVLGYCMVPEYYKAFHMAFKRGQNAINFQAWDFEHLLHENIQTLLAQIFKHPEKNILYI